MSVDRLLQLLERRRELLAQDALALGPLIVYHGAETLPKTPQAVVDHAASLGRQIVHVRFVASDGNGGRPVTVALPGGDAENREAAQRRD